MGLINFLATLRVHQLELQKRELELYQDSLKRQGKFERDCKPFADLLQKQYQVNKKLRWYEHGGLPMRDDLD